LRHGALLALILTVLGFTVGCTRKHPPPGSQYAMAEVLLRHEVATPRSQLGPKGARCPCYVLVGAEDLPTARAAALADTGVTFLPASAWSVGKGLRVHIGLPRTRWNGNFDVAVGYDCDAERCAETASSIVRYDGSRWRVIR
jgi:hypothetical protein